MKQDFHENRLLQDLASIQRREYSGFGKEEEKKENEMLLIMLMLSLITNIAELMWLMMYDRLENCSI